MARIDIWPDAVIIDALTADEREIIKKATLTWLESGKNDWTERFEVSKLPDPSQQRLIEKVAETTRGRRDNYGRPLLNFLRIALLWDDHLRNTGKSAENKVITPADVAYMMILLKVAREEHSWSDDSLLDIMGYADCLDDINQHLKTLGLAGGVQALEKMSRTELEDLRDSLT